MRRVAALSCLVLLAAACQDAPDPVAPLAPPDPSLALGVQDQVFLLRLRDEVADPDATARGLVAAHGGRLRSVWQHALRGFSANLAPQAVDALSRNPLVASVEADGEVTISATTQNGATWGIDRIDQRSGTNGTYTYDYSGAGVDAYIIDTGIRYDHVDFGGRAVAGFDAVTAGGTASDCNGHGTHVAGTVGGATWGVAKAVRLIGVRVLNCQGSGTYEGVINGINWAASHHQAGVTAVGNMSLGGGFSSTINAAVQGAIDDGIVMVVAAGNSNANACNYSPASTASAITVGSTTSTDARSYFSNYGDCVDIFAPGSSITSAWYTTSMATNTISGTSMASPHVAGAAALYLQELPASTPQQVRDGLLARSTRDVVGNALSTNDHLLYTLGGTVAPPPPPPTGFVLTATGSKVKGLQRASLSWSGSSATSFDVWRDGAKIASTTGSSYVDAINQKGGGSYTYRVCNGGTTTCSNNATVTF